MRRIATALFCLMSCYALSLAAEQQDSSPQTLDSSQQANAAQPPRRALRAPLDGIFPGSEYLGPTPLIGVPDTDPVWPLIKALWEAYPAFKKTRIKVYGWINAGGTASTSNDSNIPESHAIVPNKLEMDQAVLHRIVSCGDRKRCRHK